MHDQYLYTLGPGGNAKRLNVLSFSILINTRFTQAF